MSVIHTKQKFALLSITRLQSTLAQIQPIKKKLKREVKKKKMRKNKNEQSNKRSSSRTRSCISVSERPTASFQSKSKTKSQRTKKKRFDSFSLSFALLSLVTRATTTKKKTYALNHTL